jgi:hypothetical protein
MPYKVGWKRMLVAAWVVLAFQTVVAWGVGIGRPFRGDEPHFVETIIEFGTRPLNLDLLAHYNEMSGPVPFVLYGTWGRLFGFGPQALRLFSIVVGLATYLLWYWFLHSETGSLRLAAGGTAFVALHPYVLYLSLFVYTDMLAILCLIGALIAVRRERPLALAAFLCAAVLNRQYLIFGTAAAGCYFLARCWKTRERRDALSVIAVAGSTLPLAALCLLWRGLCPDGALKQVYFDQHLAFHVPSLVLYVSLAALYLAPILAFRWQGFFGQQASCTHNFAAWVPGVAALLLCGLYFFYPVTPSRPAIEAGIEQVGMLHQALHRLFASSLVEHATFFMGFVIGVAVVVRIGLDAAARWRRGEIDFQFFLDLNVILFLAVMPFSYLHWEKYFIPLVPVLLLRIGYAPLPADNSTAESRNGNTAALFVVSASVPGPTADRAA